MPGLWNERGKTAKDGQAELSGLPEDPFNRQQVREWQAHAQAPAARQRPAPNEAEGPGGPEGLAEQFAFKVASGIFNQDISLRTRQVGMATHFACGST